MKTADLKKLLVIALAFMALVILAAAPAPPGLSPPGKNTLGLTLFFLIMLIAKPVPLPISCLMMIAMMPFMSANSPPGGPSGSGGPPEVAGALAGFANPVLYFTIASFALSYAFISVPLSNRILRLLLNGFARSTKSLLLSVMVCEAVVSFVISNIPATTIFIALGLGILNTVPDEAKRKSIGKPLMIGITFAGMIGGMATPAGSSLNMLAISLLQKSTGVTITFVQWIAVGLPLAAVLIPIAWFVILKVYRPAELTADDLAVCAGSIYVPEKMETNEKIFLFIFPLTITLWILSSWVPLIDVSMVAIVSACVCFLPGLNILAGKEFASFAKWDVFFVQGSSLSLGLAMIAHGVDKWFADLFLNSLPVLPPFLLVAACAVFVFFMLIIIPIAPAMISIFSVQLISIAASQNVPPTALIFVLALCTSNCYLLPLDSVPLLGFETGYFNVPDLVKSSLIMQIIIVGLLTLWIPVMVL